MVVLDPKPLEITIDSEKHPCCMPSCEPLLLSPHLGVDRRMAGLEDALKSSPPLEGTKDLSFRALFLSDCHLGLKDNNSEALLSFLECVDSAMLYLVGDIIDGWSYEREGYWDKTAQAIFEYCLAFAGDGGKVFLLPGNHDDYLRDMLGFSKNNFYLQDSVIHKDRDGRGWFVTHGDQFDPISTTFRPLSKMGSWIYEVALSLRTAKKNRPKGYMSFGLRMKIATKAILQFLFNARLRGLRRAKRHDCYGIIQGHTHKALIAYTRGKGYYLNTGDWVEDSSFIAERLDGSFALMRWDNKKLCVEVLMELDFSKAKYPKPKTLFNEK